MCERARPVSNAVLGTFDPCQVILDCITLLTLLCKELMVTSPPKNSHFQGGEGGEGGQFSYVIIWEVKF